MISSRIYWIAGANESALGLQSKYKAPRKKFDTLSVNWNCMGEADSPSRRNYEP